jgi:hypothetical protein
MGVIGGIKGAMGVTGGLKGAMGVKSSLAVGVARVTSAVKCCS